MPWIDEHVQAVGREVRELARLHAQLAGVEMRDGVRRLVGAVCLLGFAVLMATLVLVAGDVALFSLLQGPLSTPAAAATVALVDLAVAALGAFFGWRLLRGAGSLLLPRTRSMLVELLTCRDTPKNS